MARYEYKNGFIKSAFLTLFIVIVECIVVYSVSLGIGCLLGCSLFLDNILIGSIIMVLLAFILRGGTVEKKLKMDCLHLFFLGLFGLGLILSIGSLIVILRGSVPILSSVLLCVLLLGLLLFFLGSSVRIIYKSILGARKIYYDYEVM